MCNVVKRTSLFVVVFALLLPCVISYAGTVELPRTGQETCFDEDGMVIDCTGTGHDGDIQAGVEWPDPRFTDNGDGTIKDNLTGLIWLKDANCFGEPIWQESLDIIADFNSDPGSFGCSDHTASFTDWRLPNINEIESLVNSEESDPNQWLNGQGFSNVQSFWYWSSTTSSFAHLTSGAWVVDMLDGIVCSINKSDDHGHVWPVRAGEWLPPIFSFENLYRCYLRCRKNKRNTINALKFQISAEENLFKLSDELINKTYKPSRSVCFILEKPKMREIVAADFRDRVVHHVLVERLEAIYVPKFSYEAFACRKGKGLHKAVNRVKQFIDSVCEHGRKTPYFLHMDIKNFFMTIDKEIL